MYLDAHFIAYFPKHFSVIKKKSKNTCQYLCDKKNVPSHEYSRLLLCSALNMFRVRNMVLDKTALEAEHFPKEFPNKICKLYIKRLLCAALNSLPKRFCSGRRNLL